ncbi:MAG: sugar ABC transporter permease [Smithella sp.]
MKSKSAKKWYTTLKFRDSTFGFLLTVPALVVLCIVIALPILKGIYVSFCDYKLADLKSIPDWNNFKNYIGLFKSGEIFTYFSNTILFVFFAVIIQFILGLIIALLLNSKIHGRNIFRGFFLIPWTIPSVVVAILWRWMLHQQFGVINYLLNKAGITDSVNISWTLSPSLAMISIIMAAVWRQLPYMMVMILAGLQSVDISLIEAAKIDGASSFQILNKVTLPLIRPVIVTSIWIAIMSNFQMYTIIQNMTGGGPVNATTTLSIAAYRAAFQSYNFGKGAAIGVLWLLLLFGITLSSNKMNEKFAKDNI